MPKKIGLSLSFCVPDIARGDVKLEDVESIIASTNFAPEDLEDTFKRYMDMKIWNERCWITARILARTNRIHQPRLLGEVPEGEKVNVADFNQRWRDA